MFFEGTTRFETGNLIWKTWAPPKVKFFMYIALHRRTWTAEGRMRHGLQDCDTCALCDQEQETIEHLLLHCSMAKQIWWRILQRIELESQF